MPRRAVAVSVAVTITVTVHWVHRRHIEYYLHRQRVVLNEPVGTRLQLAEIVQHRSHFEATGTLLEASVASTGWHVNAS